MQPKCDVMAAETLFLSLSHSHARTHAHTDVTVVPDAWAAVGSGGVSCCLPLNY
jgi:hypothetical protein